MSCKDHITAQNSFEFSPRVGTARQKMLATIGAILPLLLGLHSNQDGTIKVLGTEFGVSSLGTILGLLTTLLFVLTITFGLRLLEARSNLNKGIAVLSQEVAQIKDAIGYLREFEPKIVAQQKFMEKQISHEAIKVMKKEGFFDSVIESFNSLSDESIKFRSILRDVQFNNLPPNLTPPNYTPLLNLLERIPSGIDLREQFDNWSAFEKSMDGFLIKATAAVSNLNELESTHKFRARQSMATNLRWKWFEGWLPLCFSVVIFVWAVLKLCCLK